MAKPKGELFKNALDVHAGADQSKTVGSYDRLVSSSEQLPDKGPNYFEARLFIMDHGRETETEAGRDPEWIDFTEIDGVYRINSVPDVISIGAETTRPYVFKASSVSVSLNNSDFIFDNLKKAHLVTVNGNTAKFLSTPGGSNLDLNFRPAKIVGRFPEGEMTVEYDLGHFNVKSIATSTDGKAKISLDSLEKPFIETQANKVKEGRNWYFDRSVKFLADELIKSVRREYSNGQEQMVTNDKVALTGIETPDGDRVFSDFGRPIAEVLPEKTGINQGEKRLVVTAAAKRNIFRSRLLQNVSVGSNVLRIRIQANFTLRKGDVITIGNNVGSISTSAVGNPGTIQTNVPHGLKSGNSIVISGHSGSTPDINSEHVVTVTGDDTFTIPVNITVAGSGGSYVFADWDDLNEEKLTVLEDAVFTTTATDVNVRVSTVFKEHKIGQVVERWMLYLGCTREIETTSECYVIAFDPDRDEQVSLITTSNSGNSSQATLRYPPRYMLLNQTINEYNIPTLGKLVLVGSVHTIPGKPGEDANILVWTIDQTIDWDSSSHLSLDSETLIDAETSKQGLYTGEMNFRSMTPIGNTELFDVDGDSDEKSDRFGAMGLGQMVASYKDEAGLKYMGFGYVAALSSPAYNGETTIGVSGRTINDELWIVNPIYEGGEEIFGGTIYLIGPEPGNETFDSTRSSFSSRIKKAYKSGDNRIDYELENSLNASYDREDTIVVVVPDTGKMYVKNSGENIIVQEEQTVSFGEYDSVDDKTSKLDSDFYHDTVKINRKKEIDGKKDLTQDEKSIVGTSTISPGYYSPIIQKRKFQVEKGDIITEGLSPASSYGIRAVPAQYVGFPVATELLQPAPLNTIGAAGVRNMHCWCYPIIGLWVKYEKYNKLILSFDGSSVAENGNVELLGYWYLDYDTPSDPQNDSKIEPRIELAFCNSDGLVTVSSQTIPDSHFPLCSVLHNITIYDPTGYGADDFKGTISGKISEIVGGYYEMTRHGYYIWRRGSSDFMKTFPFLTSWGKTVQWKFKALRNPQAKGSLFVSPYSMPVRPRHFHLPLSGIESFQRDADIDLAQTLDRNESEIETLRIANAPIVDTNFLLGSEELFNYDEDGNLNFWVADRFSQGKSLGLVQGIGHTRATGGMLRGFKLTDADGDHNVNIPMGFKNTGRRFVCQTDQTIFSVTHIKYLSGTSYEVTLSESNAFATIEYGTIVQINESSDSSIEGLFTLIANVSSTKVQLEIADGADVQTSLDAAVSAQLYRYYGQGIDLPLIEGDTYKTSSQPMTFTATDIDKATISFTWMRDAEPPTLPAFIFDRQSGSGPSKMYFRRGTVEDASSSQSTGFQATVFGHYDYYPYADVGSDVSHITFEKIFFQTPPTGDGFLNYPKALYARTLHKFWKYYPRQKMAIDSIQNGVGVITDIVEGYWRSATIPGSGSVLQFEIEDGRDNTYEIWVQNGTSNTELGIVGADTWAEAVYDFAEIINNGKDRNRKTMTNLGAYVNKDGHSLNIYARYIGTQFNSNNYGMEIQKITRYQPEPSNQDRATIYFNPNPDFANAELAVNDKLMLYNYGPITLADGSSIPEPREMQINGNAHVKVINATNTSSGKVDVEGLFTHGSVGAEIETHDRVNGFIAKLDDLKIRTTIDVSNVFPVNLHFIPSTGGNTGLLLTDRGQSDYGSGDGQFQSEDKPTEWGASFVDSMAKWYLSREDSGSSTNCDTYTINHDGPFLGNDDKLYSIVNRNPLNTALRKFNYARFCINAQKNFKTFPAAGDTFYFTRRKFAVTEQDKLQIDTHLWSFHPSSGLSEYGSFPKDIQETVDIIDENGSSTGVIDEGLGSDGVQINAIDENISVFNEIDSRGDWEVHGLFNSWAGSQINAGIMRWKNFGDCNLTKYRNYDNTTIFDRDHENFSNNVFLQTTDGSIWTKIQWQEYPEFSSTEEVPIDGGSGTWANVGINIYASIHTTLPLSIKQGGGTVPVWDGSGAPPIPSWTYVQTAEKEYFIYLNSTNTNDIVFVYENPDAERDYEFHSKFLDENFELANLFMIKGWTEENEDYTFGTTNYKCLRGIVMRRQALLSDDSTERGKREFPIVLAVQPDQEKAYFSEGNYHSSDSLKSMRKFDFRVDSANDYPYYFTDSFDNSLKAWDGIDVSFGSGSVIDSNIGLGLPTVEGDFGQYDLMLKLDNPYEEIFGFSAGFKTHIAATQFKGGRNVVWKLSKALSFHIPVADFGDITVWEALSQFAELTDSLLGFDRNGYLHMESRPPIASNTAYTFTFDKLSLGNVISIEKKPAFSHIYNHVEIIPSKPVLPEPKVNLITNSDLNVVTANHNTFIEGFSLDTFEQDKTKTRPEIFAYQKDYERKRIVLICTNGEFNVTQTEGSGLYSRWKYLMINDTVEIRLSETIVVGRTDVVEIKVNQIPYNNLSNKLFIESGDQVLIGGNGPFTVASVDLSTKTITLTTSLDHNTRYENGQPVSVIDPDTYNEIYHATGQGTKEDELTYSPKTFFTEIGEWTFDLDYSRTATRLAVQAAASDSEIVLEETAHLQRTGSLSINGTIVEYNNIENQTVQLTNGLKKDFAIGAVVYPMPPKPILEGISNPLYAPGDWRIGGYDEIGQSCLDEYHLFDPNEDKTPYYNADPAADGKPITALEFYWEGQKVISYADEDTNPTSPYTVSNSEYRNRHRTFVNMKINFNGFRFLDGDKIDIDLPGIRLEPQVHLKKIESDFNSIERNGLRPYPATNNRFFNNTTASIVAKRIVRRMASIGSQTIITAKIEDVPNLNFIKIARIIDQDMFSGMPNNEVRGYMSNLKFNSQRKLATITCLTEEL